MVLSGSPEDDAEPRVCPNRAVSGCSPDAGQLNEKGELLNEKGELSFAFQGLAEWTGLEPATPGVTGRYSNQLNYHSLCCALSSAGGCRGARTPDIRLVRATLYQLS